MILIAHISIALASVAYATYLVFHPTHNRLRLSYALLLGTLGSGTYLTVQHPGHLLASCLSGLVYFLVVAMLTARAQQRLATADVRHDRSSQ